MRDVQAAAESILSADGERLALLAKHDPGVFIDIAAALIANRARLEEAAEALHEAEVGLEFAGADKDIPEGEFVPTPTLALRNVRTTIAKLKGGK